MTTFHTPSKTFVGIKLGMPIPKSTEVNAKEELVKIKLVAKFIQINNYNYMLILLKTLVHVKILHSRQKGME